MLGMMGMGSDALMGKLRLRLSCLAPGHLHNVDLPLRVSSPASR